MLLSILSSAHHFEEWEGAALELDVLSGNDYWRHDPSSTLYDHKALYKLFGDTYDAVASNTIPPILQVLRSGLMRNVGNIAKEDLYTKAWAGTKFLIEDYVSQVAVTIRVLIDWKTTTGTGEGGVSIQEKLDTLHDARQAYGRSCLVMQGGSIFGLCHLGVVKALHLRGILPRIIAGTATGALMAALVGTHTEDELLNLLNGSSIDLSAFAAASERAANASSQPSTHANFFVTLIRRARRFLRYGYILDPRVLEDCVRTNIGDVTFEEAYNRTKRVLNITVSTPHNMGVPTLLNYLTAPNVLIWSAALASNASGVERALWCRDREGKIVSWDMPAPFIPPTSGKKNQRPRGASTATRRTARHTPLSRVAELFNVNHFIVSQARPYIAPFLAPSLHHTASRRTSSVSIRDKVMRLLMLEIQHRLTQLDTLGYLPPSIRRLLLDETIPGLSWVLVPKVSWRDFLRLLRNPTRAEIDYWILRGERSVWPSIGALKIRCTVEVELDRGYQLVRRRPPFEAGSTAMVVKEGVGKDGWKRARASSMGGGYYWDSGKVK